VSAVAVASWWLYWKLVPGLRPSTWTQGYLGAVPLYLLTHLLTLSVELAFGATGHAFPTHMRWPFLASSIDEFWGRRWATWVSEWFRQVIFKRYRTQPLFGGLLVFVVSGLWHEVLIDVPLLAFYGINVLGGWLLYFVIQGVGAALERLLFERASPLRVLFAWAVIVLPAPLAVNEATLRAIVLYV
jgi:hypothetical protein